MTRFQDEPDDDDELDDSEGDDDDMDKQTQEVLRFLREEAEGNDGEDGSSLSASETPARSFGDVFWEKNFLLAITVTKYLSAACIVLVFLFFVTIVLKAFAFR